MDWARLAVFLAIGVVLTVLAASAFWLVYGKRRWSLAEFTLCCTVGSLPLLVAIQSGLLPTEGVPKAAVAFNVALALVMGELWSFAGAALGLSQAPDLGPGTARRRLYFVCLGWLGFTAMLALCGILIYFTEWKH
jgi:hypothetical protein